MQCEIILGRSPVNQLNLERQRRGYLLVMGIAALLAVFEVGGGIYAWSFVLLVDAGHVLGDVVVYAFSAYAMREKMEGRSMADSGNRNANIVIGVAVFNIALSLTRMFFFAEHTTVVPHAMLSVAAIGLFVNIIMVVILLSLGLEHGHGGHACAHHPHKHEKNWVHRLALIHIAGDVGISIFAVTVAAQIKFRIIELPGINPEQMDSLAACVAGAVIIALALREKRGMRKEREAETI